MDNSLAITCQPPAIGIDFTNNFVTDQAFEKREDLVEWAREVGRSLRFTVSIHRSDNGAEDRKPFVVLCCSKKRNLGCPFRLRGYYHASKEWHLSVVCGVHNHELCNEKSAGRLKKEDKELIIELSKKAVPAKEMKKKLKEVSLKQVYNARHRLKKYVGCKMEGQAKEAFETKEQAEDEVVESEEKTEEEVESDGEIEGAKYIDFMPKFMKRHIEDIIDVRGDGFCGYRVVATDIMGSEDNFEEVKERMLYELKNNKSMYMAVYGGKERYNFICKALQPPRRSVRHGVAPLEYWFTFPDMGHLVATHYNKVVVQLTKPSMGISETFFPLRGSPSIDTPSHIICIGLVPSHFVYVKLKDGCPIPPTAVDWRIHRSEEAAAWEFAFLDRQMKFLDLIKNERGHNIYDGVGCSHDQPIEL